MSTPGYDIDTFCATAADLYNPALESNKVKLDNRSEADMFCYLSKLAREFWYYNLEGKRQGDWSDFFHSDMTALLLILSKSDKREEEARAFYKVTAAALTPGAGLILLTEALELVLQTVADLHRVYSTLQTISAQHPFTAYLEDSIWSKLRLNLQEICLIYGAHLQGLDKSAVTEQQTRLQEIFESLTEMPSVWSVQLYPSGEVKAESEDSSNGAKDIISTICDTKSVDKAVTSQSQQLLLSAFESFYNSYAHIVSKAAEYVELVKKDGDTQPHIALLLSFLHLFQYQQQKLNSLVSGHMDFYYQHLLRFLPKPTRPDEAYVTISLKKEVAGYLLTEGNDLIGGKDEAGEPILFEVVQDTWLAAAKLEGFQVGVLTLTETILTEGEQGHGNTAVSGGNKKGSETPEANTAKDGSSSITTAANAPQPDDAKNTARAQQENTPPAEAKQAADSDLEPAVSKKTIAREEAATGEKVKVKNFNKPKQNVQTGEIETVSVKALVQQAVVANEVPIPVLKGFSFGSPCLLLGSGDRMLEIDLELAGKSVAAVLVNSFTLSITGAKGWVALSTGKELAVGPSLKDANRPVLKLKLKSTDAAFVPYEPDLHGEGYNSPWPILRFELKPEESLNMDLSRLQVSFYGLVTGVKDMKLITPDGDITDAVGTIKPFGQLQRSGSEVIIGAPELFVKPNALAKLSFQWANLLNQRDFYEYYEPYLIFRNQGKKTAFAIILQKAQSAINTYKSLIQTQYRTEELRSQFSDFTAKINQLHEDAIDAQFMPGANTGDIAKKYAADAKAIISELYAKVEGYFMMKQQPPDSEEPPVVVDHPKPGDLVLIPKNGGGGFTLDKEFNLNAYQFELSFLSAGEWKSAAKDLSAIFPAPVNPEGPNETHYEFSLQENELPDAPVSSEEPLSASTKTGYLKLNLADPADPFSMKLYPAVLNWVLSLNTQIMANNAMIQHLKASGNEKARLQTAKPLKDMPNAPFVPELNSITLDYEFNQPPIALAQLDGVTIDTTEGVMSLAAVASQLEKMDSPSSSKEATASSASGDAKAAPEAQPSATEDAQAAQAAQKAATDKELTGYSATEQPDVKEQAAEEARQSDQNRLSSNKPLASARHPNTIAAAKAFMPRADRAGAIDQPNGGGQSSQSGAYGSGGITTTITTQWTQLDFAFDYLEAGMHLNLFLGIATKKDSSPVRYTVDSWTTAGWQSAAVLSDTTYQLQADGVVKLRLQGTPTTGCPGNDEKHYVVRMLLPLEADVHLTMVDTNGVLVKRKIEEGDRSPKTLLPKESIGDMAVAIPELDKIVQPFDTFGLRMAESPGIFRRNTSNRLQHKGRATSVIACQKLLLNHFPELYAVNLKLNETPAGRPEVIVYLVPWVESMTAPGWNEPSAKPALIEEVTEFLKARISDSLTLAVKRAIPSAYKANIEVAFNREFDQDLLKEQLNEALNEYLSPWLRVADQPYTKKWVEARVLMAFVQQLPYVRYVENLSLTDLSTPGSTTDNLYPTDEAYLLVPARQHEISTITLKAL